MDIFSKINCVNLYFLFLIIVTSMKKVFFISLTVLAVTFLLSSCGVAEPCPNYSEVSGIQENLS